MNKVFFPATYTRTLARELGLDAKGIAVLLKGTRLQSDFLQSLSSQVDEDCQRTIICNALALSNMPALGLRWGANLHLAAHGPLGAMISSSANLTQAWRALEKYHNVRGGGIRVHGVSTAEYFAVELDMIWPNTPEGRFFLEAALATLLNHLAMIVGQHNPALAVELGYPAPDYAGAYETFLKVPCRFGCDATRVLIPHGLSHLPNPMADADVYELALRRCEDLLQAQKPLADWTSRVNHLLRMNPGQIWTSEQVASHFHVSTRTLLRNLAEEGTTYQGLRDLELCRQAQRNLLVPNNTVESVALGLGYQEVSNFRRAFKRWTGLSPQEFILAQRRA